MKFRPHFSKPPAGFRPKRRVPNIPVEVIVNEALRWFIRPAKPKRRVKK